MSSQKVCDICGRMTGDVQTYGLRTSMRRKKPESGWLVRGAGSIDLCREDWSTIAEGRMKPRRAIEGIAKT